MFTIRPNGFQTAGMKLGREKLFYLIHNNLTDILNSAAKLVIKLTLSYEIVVFFHKIKGQILSENWYSQRVAGR